ncbi:MAG: hypothetical protein E7550_04795 [Ruminococcaceae bacterium]|nr:hypothetical protein [Oscillospiraceae bacterium]
MKQYHDEYEGQRDFYSRVGINPDLSHNTDGVDRGNLYENKVDIKNIYEVLSQAIKYASRIRIRGEKLPANLILNDLNRETAYIFKSADLLKDIEKVYFGAASRNNETYKTEAKYITIDYSTSTGLQELLTIVNSEDFVKYHVDKNNIVGLSQQFYKHSQDKDKFIKGENAEIRNPNVLQDRIYPYEKADNIEFEDIMDCLNPGLLQREQGAYYTPTAYVNEMHKMLIKAIKEIPKGMDYIIIDRCAGTGNLEEGLPDEILEHCVLSTIEFNEYAILNYKYGDKCLVVIPNIDALAYDIIPAEKNEQGIANDFIRERVNDPNCVVILMENPPYSESGSGGVQGTGKKENVWKQSYVIQEMKKEYKGVALNDLSNLFIWSGFKFYLKKPTDSYILYAPTKYWRNQSLANKKFEDGFLCNRKEFHANQVSAIGCIWWKNIDDTDTKQITLTPYDIENQTTSRATNDITIKKAFYNLSYAYDKRPLVNYSEDGIICERDGSEFVSNGRKVYIKPIYSNEIIAYLVASNFQIDRKDVMLTRCGIYKAHGFYLRSDNFTEKLPLFVAATFPYDKWYKADVYSKSYDGQGSFLKDKNFLKKCLFYTALTPKNKCKSFLGSDKRFYRNELCFDREDTLAWQSLQEYLKDGLELSEIEETLLKYWRDVLFEASKTDEYKAADKKVRYGLWQIMQELNIKIDSGRKDKKGNPVMVYKYNALNSEIKKLDDALKNYYSNEIIPMLFEYELIK